MAFSLSFRRVRRELRTPFPTAFGTLSERETIAVELRDPDGVIGRGEAAPLAPYDGVTLEDCEHALARYAKLLATIGDIDARGSSSPLALCAAIDPLPQALAAIDLALWDRAGILAGRPVAALLAGAQTTLSSSVQINQTIGAVSAERAAALTAAAIAAGCRCIKVKVACGDDLARVAAVADAADDAGAALKIRIDANGGWDVPTATQMLERLATAAAGRLEFCEEPVSGVDALLKLRDRLDPAIKLAADESVAGGGLLTAGIVAAVCLKIARAGGIGALCAQAALARSAGSTVYIASTFDGPLGIAAALHCAAALAIEHPCGLATLDQFTAAPPPQLLATEGRIQVPSGPGLLAAATL